MQIWTRMGVVFGGLVNFNQDRPPASSRLQPDDSGSNDSIRLDISGSRIMNTQDNDNEPLETPTDSLESASATGPESEQRSNADVDQLRVENAELQDRLLRTQAELENFRRRTQKEALEASKYQALPIIRGLLPGIDNLQRAIDAAEQSGDTQNLIDGIRMVAQQFQDALKSLSAEQMNPEGQAFDPNLHEALSQVPSADHEPMTVIQVVEAGYRLHDRVIRPAKVIVTCAPPSPAADAGAGDDSEDL